MGFPQRKELEEVTKKKIEERMKHYKEARILEIFTEGEGNPEMVEVGAIVGIIEPLFISKEELDELRREGNIYKIQVNGKNCYFSSQQSLNSFLEENELKDFKAEVVRYRGKII